MPAQFSKDKSVFLFLEYTKRRGRKGVQNEIIQEFIYKIPGVWLRRPSKKNIFLRIFVIIHSIVVFKLFLSFVGSRVLDKVTYVFLAVETMIKLTQLNTFQAIRTTSSTLCNQIKVARVPL